MWRGYHYFSCVLVCQLTYIGVKWLNCIGSSGFHQSAPEVSLGCKMTFSSIGIGWSRSRLLCHYVPENA